MPRELEHVDADAAAPSKPIAARSLTVAKAGLRTGFDMINLMTATITDVLEEVISTNQAKVVVSSANTVLTVVELQLKYGKPRNADGRGDLVLTQ
jgi:hypothetical protein